MGCYRPLGSLQSLPAAHHMCSRVSKFPIGRDGHQAIEVALPKGPACHLKSAGCWTEAVWSTVLEVGPTAGRRL
jgi:hypothetical protein